MAKLNPEIVAGFVDEGRSYIVQIQHDLRAWNGRQGAGEGLTGARRLVHTIKGAASMIGMPALAQASFLLEETLEAVIRGELYGSETAAGLELALQSIDFYFTGAVRGDLHPAPHLQAAVLVLRSIHAGLEGGDDLLALTSTLQPDEIPTAEIASDGLLDTFRQEAEDHLQIMGRALRSLEDNPSDKGVLGGLRRSLHSMKGAARAVGIEGLATLAHRLEDVLDALADDQLTFEDASSLIYRAFDAISDMALDATATASSEDLDAQLAALLRAPEPRQEVADVPLDEDDIPAEFLDTFRQEADEHLQTVAVRLRDLEKDPTHKDSIQEIRRAVHTLKGAAGVIGLNSLGALAHRMEDLLDAAWEGSLKLTAERIQLFFATADVMTDLVADPEKRTTLRPRVIELFRQYQTDFQNAGALQDLPKSRSTADAEPEIDLAAFQTEVSEKQPGKANTSSQQYVRVPIERLDEMVRLVSELVVTRSVFEKHVNSHASEVSELNLSLGRLRRLSSQFDTDSETQALKGNLGRLNVRVMQSKSGGDKRSEFHALEFDRYTGLNLMSRDLAETSSDISSAVGQLENRSGDFESCLNRLGRLTSDVQDRLMRMRMVPLSNLATRLHRTVRVTAERLNKHIDLVLEGEQVEIDKTMLEELAGPLEHLLRNAVDHGLESPAERIARNKPQRGRIQIRAYYLGTQIVLEVRDDGAGMDAAAIREKAVKNGFLGTAEAAELSDRDVFEFVFQPGFSTAKAVGAISGRGVGLDVVRTAVRKLRGTVDIESKRGVGTTFRIYLPMSLAILRVLLVQARGNQYAIPLGVITRILRLAPDQIEYMGQQQVLRIDGKVMPAIRLVDALENAGTRDDSPTARCPALVLDLGGQQLAVIVDELEEAREVVVKSMGSVLQHVHGVAGATIMGDGSIVLIVNPAELAVTGSARTSTPVAVTRNADLEIMVVDDSVSVRRVLSNLLRNQGWSAITARDGMEALEMLQAGRIPDAVLLDMEMPRMDGYELISVLRSQPQFANLPIIMLTSRAGAKHRQKAFDLGVTDYLVKPYQEENLLATLRRAVVASSEQVR